VTESLLAAFGVAGREQEALAQPLLFVAARGEEKGQASEEGGAGIHGRRGRSGHHRLSGRARQSAACEVVDRGFRVGGIVNYPQRGLPDPPIVRPTVRSRSIGPAMSDPITRNFNAFLQKNRLPRCHATTPAGTCPGGRVF
jgi:hypothetical protein